MRLICPNCDAQYEVPDDVMPTEGRDVQCSNCGQTWFQDHPDTIAAREASRPDTPHEDEEVVQVAPEPTPEPEPSEPEPEPAAALDVPTFEPEPPEPEPARRTLDPTVTDVLREEAARETRARESEGSLLESQPDLGLSEGDEEAEKRAREAKDRMARMRGEAPAVPPGSGMAATAGADSRRDLLPDIEEINSTLRSNESRSPSDDPGQTAQIEVQEKRASRRGFTLTIALVAVLALVYSYAEQLATSIPAAEQALAVYVNMVEGWRTWLNEQISSLMTWLDAITASEEGQ